MLYLKGYTRELTLNTNFLLAVLISYKLCYQSVLIYLENSHLNGYLMGNPIYVFYNPLAYLVILMCSTLTLYRAASDPTYLERGGRNQPAPQFSARGAPIGQMMIPPPNF